MFKEYNASVDQSLFVSLIEKWVSDQPEAFRAPLLKVWLERSSSGVEGLAAGIYEQSAFTSLAKVQALLNADTANLIAAIKNDPAWQLYNSLSKTYSTQVQQA
ncbi:MAG: S46 family peptidase [Ferruginibacter sp.]